MYVILWAIVIPAIEFILSIASSQPVWSDYDKYNTKKSINIIFILRGVFLSYRNVRDY